MRPSLRGFVDAVVPPWSDIGMTSTKRKVSLLLDEELIAELASDVEGLSSQVNDAVRAEVERRRRHRTVVVEALPSR